MDVGCGIISAHSKTLQEGGIAQNFSINLKSTTLLLHRDKEAFLKLYFRAKYLTKL